jgi:hypothetical protein
MSLEMGLQTPRRTWLSAEETEAPHATRSEHENELNLNIAFGREYVSSDTDRATSLHVLYLNLCSFL